MQKTGSAGVYTGVLLMLSAATPVLTQEAPSTDPASMISGGDIAFDFRYRYESVDQDGFDRDAGASTLRSRLSFSSASWQGLSFVVEVDNVSVIGSERYNSTENGETDYPVVADPKGTDVNQAAIRYATGGLSGTYGRRRILHSGQRFIGGVGFRQNEQTYDGFRAQWSQAEVLKLDYSYVYNVNRIFGPDDGANPANLHGSNHFLYGAYTLAENHRLAAYAYLLDFDQSSGYASGKTVDNSSDTYGLEYQGKFGPLTLYGAYATQSEAGDNTRRYDADFYKIDGSLQLSTVQLKAGWEVLGAGDGVGFATPLATLHKFQGWADVFLTTPADGIEDAYIGISGKVGPVKLQAIYHDFSAEDSSDSYGDELDLAASWAFNKQFSTQLSYADYDADDFSVDTRKLWLTLHFKI